MSDSPQLSPPDSKLRDSKLRELIDAAQVADGHPPFSDGSLAELATGARRVVWLGAAAALVSETEAEFVVHPDARRRGCGRALLHELLTAAPGDLLLWAHGAHPAARRLAATHGLEPVRELLRLSAAVPVAAEAGVGAAVGAGPGVVAGAGVAIGDAGATGAGAGAAPEYSHELREVAHLAPLAGAISRNSSSWHAAVAELLELNGRAFTGHPDQGNMTRAQFDALAAEPWFDAADVLLLRAGSGAGSGAGGAGGTRAGTGQLLGFCWLKIEAATVGGPIVDRSSGEFYVVAVDPAHQGQGVGRSLMAAGFARLGERGIHEAHLYVEADNTAALRLYREFGFREDSIDIQYRWASEPDD